jgi:transaldolase/glucose-6-phosphate isomerase
MPAGGHVDAVVAARLVRFADERFAARLWAADTSLWKPGDAHHQAVIGGALGWLTVFEDVRDQVEGLYEFLGELRADGFRHAVLLGMGGSSLAPEVLARVLDAAPGGLELIVLDSTDPAAVAAVEACVDLERTLFIVASKSGGTTETASFHAYFYERLRELEGDHAGHHFVAITDEDTSLQRQALAQDFRAVFVNPSDIGGRYSALSFFGLVPAVLSGLDLAKILDGAARMAAACAADVPPAENPALVLGARLGEFALAGRDKLTLVTPSRLAPLGAWVEQLVAESTGKEGAGILPVDLEPLGPPEVYGDDRVFVVVGLEGEAVDETRLAALEAAGHPVLRHELALRYDIGGEFLRWELATAAAGAVLGIDPFDQPNVQESKDNTKTLLKAYAEAGELPAEDVGGGRFAFPAHDDALGAALDALFEGAAPGEYLAIQAFVKPDHAVWEALQAVRVTLRDRLHVATTLGYGPRYLHSTGQLHKGGPGGGLFLQVIGHDPDDVAVPGQPYSFGVLKRAQARGDLAALRARGKPAVRVCLGDDVGAGLERLAALVAGA